MNAFTRLPSTKTNKNAKRDLLRCYRSHQMDQHVLDIQRNVLFLQILHPDRGVLRHKAARRLPRIPGCGESLPTDLVKPPPRRPRVRLVRQDPLGGEVLVLTLVVRVQISGVNLKATGRLLGSGARGRSWVWSRSRLLLSPTRTAYTSCPTFRTITPSTYQDACRCLDGTSLWCCSTHMVSWRAYFWTFPCLKYLALF